MEPRAAKGVMAAAEKKRGNLEQMGNANRKVPIEEEEGGQPVYEEEELIGEEEEDDLDDGEEEF
jgi:hypothetical protein